MHWGHLSSLEVPILIEDEVRSLVRYDNLIGGDLDVDDSRLQTNDSLQSLHHCSIGYHP
jgi:hypothetical protein